MTALGLNLLENRGTPLFGPLELIRTQKGWLDTGLPYSHRREGSSGWIVGSVDHCPSGSSKVFGKLTTKEAAVAELQHCVPGSRVDDRAIAGVPSDSLTRICSRALSPRVAYTVCSVIYAHEIKPAVGQTYAKSIPWSGSSIKPRKQICALM